MGATRTTGPTDLRQEATVGSGSRQGVVLDRQRRQHLLHERLPSPALTRPGHLDPDEQLRSRDGRDRNVVIVGDRVVQTAGPSGAAADDLRR